MSDKMDIIEKLLEEVRKDVKEISKTSAKHREETFKWQIGTDGRLDRIEVDLREHKEGVINNRRLIKLAEARLDVVEQPTKTRNAIVKTILKYGAVAGAIATICKLFGLF